MTASREKMWMSLNPCPECGGKKWICWDLIGKAEVLAVSDWGMMVSPIVDCKGDNKDYIIGYSFDECVKCGTVVS